MKLLLFFTRFFNQPVERPHHHPEVVRYCTLNAVGDPRGKLTSVDVSGAEVSVKKDACSIADALNFMAEHGWEFVHSNITPTPQQNVYVYHYLLKKQ